MNEQAILHGANSKYCFAVDNKTVSLRIRFAKGEKIVALNVCYGAKYSYATVQHRAKLTCAYSDRLFDYYVVKITVQDVRLVYVFEIETEQKTYYYSEDGLTDFFDFKLAYYNSFQLPYINEIDVFKPVEYSDSLVAYQIFVDRFNRGNFIKDDRYIDLAVGEKPAPKSFAGGDILGITEKLGYIESLGVNAIYITPIFKSISNHKYDISNYKLVDENFGDNQDIKKLVQRAHELDIKIILDAVFNHCSDDLSLFQDVVEKGRDSPYHRWFMIDGNKPTKDPCNFECFASCDYMPKFNTSNEEVQEYLIDIALYWIREYDIDGWRLDVSDEVSHNFWRKFREKVKGEKPNCLIIGENWHDAYPYLKGDQYDSIMNYAFTKACLDAFAFDNHNASSLCDKLNELLMRNNDTVNSMMLNLLDSHDTVRFLTAVEENVDKLNSALAIMFFYPGIPCIYYGTELEMLGGYDPDCRRVFDWKREFEENQTKTNIKFFADLKQKELLKGVDVRITSDNGCLEIIRQGEIVQLKLIVNLDNQEIPYHNDDIIYSNLYNNGKLGKFGFIIAKGD